MEPASSKSLAEEIGEWLLEQGYALADSDRAACALADDRNSWGILWDDHGTVSRVFLPGFMKAQKRKIYLGTLYFNTTYGNRLRWWQFDACGSKYGDAHRELVDAMMKFFKVKINTSLTTECPVFEVMPLAKEEEFLKW